MHGILGYWTTVKKLRASHHLQNTKLWGDHGGKARAIYISIKYAHPCSHPCQWVCQIHCYCWLPNSSLVNVILSKHKSPTPSCSFSLQLKQWFSYTFLVISKNPNEQIKDCVCSLFFSPLAHGSNLESINQVKSSRYLLCNWKQQLCWKPPLIPWGHPRRPKVLLVELTWSHSHPWPKVLLTPSL